MYTSTSSSPGEGPGAEEQLKCGSGLSKLWEGGGHGCRIKISQTPVWRISSSGQSEEARDGMKSSGDTVTGNGVRIAMGVYELVMDLGG